MRHGVIPVAHTEVSQDGGMGTGDSVSVRGGLRGDMAGVLRDGMLNGVVSEDVLAARLIVVSGDGVGAGERVDGRGSGGGEVVGRRLGPGHGRGEGDLVGGRGQGVGGKVKVGGRGGRRGGVG